MTYVDDDQSVHDGHPIELYKFTGPTTATTYFYTSYSKDVTYSGDLYLTEPLMRNSVDIASADVPEVVIEMPTTLDLVKEYCIKTPPRSLLLTIYRRHTITGDVQKYWEGVITSISITGHQASVRSISTMDDALDTAIPPTYFHALCNHMLYDDMCTVARGSYDHATTIASSTEDTVVVNGIPGGTPDDYYRGGEIVRDTDGERRLILKQVGTTLTVSIGFRTLLVSDAVTLYAGCNHTTDDCENKFSNNTANFGGHPNLPDKDPYIWGMDHMIERESD